MSKHAWLGLALVLAMAGCGKQPGPAADGIARDSAAYRAFVDEAAQWRKQREDELLREDGWTSLVGLHWLAPGAHFVGSSPGSGIRLAVGPARLGMIVLKQGRIHLTPEAGAALSLDGEPLKGRVELRTDQAGPQSVVGFDEGKGQLSVIKRGDRHALRVKHADAPSRLGFAGLQYWDADPSWRVSGQFVPHPAGRTLQIVDIVGTVSEQPNPGVVELEREGKLYRLEAIDGGEGQLFLVFADRTSGHGSYPAGRFLDAPAADARGRVVLDFNRAYNPPCAFTPFATCPLPPPENRLDLRIEAGEKTYSPPKGETRKEQA